MRKKYQQRLAQLRDLLSEVGRERISFDAYVAQARRAFETFLSGQRDNLRASREVLKFNEKQLRERQEALEQLAREKTDGFPWLAQAYSEFLRLQDKKKESSLRTKTRPAMKAADANREASRAKRAAEKKAKVLEYVLRYYEALFPWLSDLRGEDVDDLLIGITTEKAKEPDTEGQDATRQWLTQAEYSSLPPAEKYQLALDRYWKGRKRPWQLGRDYERYVGYTYESQGFAVYYQGIVEGLEDLGRDLVATKGNCVEIVQCKYWSGKKTIHEKHINQLFGTATAYRIDHADKEVVPVFYTSTSLQPRAKQFADVLGVTYVENSPLSRYPCIKCNVSRKDGAKIYHLPFDQQYDRAVIEQQRLECYVETVAEAEALGFRRALHWRGGEPSLNG
jgi:hypothetical protein